MLRARIRARAALRSRFRAQSGAHDRLFNRVVLGRGLPAFGGGRNTSNPALNAPAAGAIILSAPPGVSEGPIWGTRLPWPAVYGAARDTARMLRFPDPTIFVVACSTQHQLTRQVRFLREENRILRSKLPERISTTPAERRRLLRFGIPLGDAIKGLISIVRPETFARWLRRGPGCRRVGKSGRPHKPEEIRTLIVRIARETGWGYNRVLGELKKLGIKSVSRSTVRRILVEHGIDPAPKRSGQSWDEFIKAHAQTLWACDFFTKTIWTALGPRVVYVLFFQHIGTRAG